MKDPDDNTQAIKEVFSSKEIQSLSDYFIKIGQPRIARDIQDEQFLYKILDATLLTQRLQAEADFIERREDRIQEHVLNLQIQAFEKAQNYNNVIITLGYAGSFAIWGFVNESLSSFDRSIIALLMGLSLIIFVYWTLFSGLRMANRSVHALRTYSKSYSSRDDFLAALEEMKSLDNRMFSKQMKFYELVFILSSLPELLAGIMMFSLITATLTGQTLTFETPFHIFLDWIKSISANLRP